MSLKAIFVMPTREELKRAALLSLLTTLLCLCWPLAALAQDVAAGVISTRPSPSRISRSSAPQRTRTSRRCGSRIRVSTTARRRSRLPAAWNRASHSGPNRRMPTAARPIKPRVMASAKMARAKRAKSMRLQVRPRRLRPG